MVGITVDRQEVHRAYATKVLGPSVTSSNVFERLAVKLQIGSVSKMVCCSLTLCQNTGQSHARSTSLRNSIWSVFRSFEETKSPYEAFISMKHSFVTQNIKIRAWSYSRRCKTNKRDSITPYQSIDSPELTYHSSRSHFPSAMEEPERHGLR